MFSDTEQRAIDAVTDPEQHPPAETLGVAYRALMREGNNPTVPLDERVKMLDLLTLSVRPRLAVAEYREQAKPGPRWLRALVGK